MSPEAGPSNVKKSSRKRKTRGEASSSHIDLTDDDDMSQKSGKLPPFMAKNKGKIVTTTKPAAQPQIQVAVPKPPLNKKEVVDSDAKIIQDRIQGASGEQVHKKQKTDGSSLQAPKGTMTATMTQHLFGTMGSKFAGETEPEAWWKADPADNTNAITRCLAEAFIRQASHTKAFNKLTASNKELDKKNKILQFQKEEDKRSFVKTYKADLEAKEEELKKSVAEVEKLSNELKDAKEAKEKAETEVAKLTRVVAKLTGDLGTAKAELAVAVEENLAMGTVEFMKEFIRKIPDFDWERLGPGNADFAATLRKEIDDEDAEEARQAEAAKANQDAPPS